MLPQCACFKGVPAVACTHQVWAFPLAMVIESTVCYAYRFADTPEEKARKLAKKTAVPPNKFSSFDILQSLAGAYPLSMDGMQPGLPAGFTAFTAAGIPDANGKLGATCLPCIAPTACSAEVNMQLLLDVTWLDLMPIVISFHFL